MVHQSCNDCAKQSICPKAEHFENYSLDGCMDFVDKIKIENIFTPEEAQMPVTYEVLLQILQSLQPAVSSRDKALDAFDEAIINLVHSVEDLEYRRIRDMHFVLSYLASQNLCNRDKLYNMYVDWCEEFDKMNKPKKDVEDING